jgi:V-type H+-transporting ATPase subunit A
LLSQIYDGIQRPLQNIADITKSIFIPKGFHILFMCIFDLIGVSTPALDPKSEWDFHPNPWKVGDNVTGGVCNFVFTLDKRCFLCFCRM